ILPTTFAVRFPRGGRRLEELAEATVKNGLLTGEGANRERRHVAAGKAYGDVFVVGAAAEVKRIAGLDSEQGVVDGPPRLVFVAVMAIVAAPGVHEERRPVRQGTVGWRRGAAQGRV